MVESGNLQINVYGDIHSSARQQVRENDILIMITFNRQPADFENPRQSYSWKDAQG